LTQRQSEMGADYIDVAAGTTPEIERETLAWLISIVQDAVDTPLAGLWKKQKSLTLRLIEYLLIHW
jgi:hypothetical protein